MERHSLVPKHHKQYVIHPLSKFDVLQTLIYGVVVHIILKGVATPEDAILAYEAGCQGIVLSNHGGRQLDTSRSGIENLIDIVAALKTKGPWPNPNFAVFVDGGVRRASDVLKALALGASAVGVGRGFLYAFSSYGQEGVERAFEILRDEFEMNMRLIGARTISEIVPEMVDASALRAHAGLTPSDNLYNTICE
jgi:L-lactate dehydrogenase (cytochrome)